MATKIGGINDVSEIRPVSNDHDDGHDRKSETLGVTESHVLQDRTIGIFGVISLIVNKVIGAGIFSTPSTILKLSGSVGMALMCWVIGCVIAVLGSFVMLEFGSAIPRSGGIKNYLQRSFPPELLQTCVYTFYCVFLEVSASNAITFSSYLLSAAGADSTTLRLRGLAVAGAVFAVGIHIFAPKIGRRLQDLLSVVKLFILFFIVCCGFAALAGRLRVEKPHNFSDAFKGTTNSGYGIGTAILNVIYSTHGYDNANAVLSEVRNPQRTLRIALPIAMGAVTVLYMLANIAYFAAVPKDDFIASEVTVAATLFENMFGTSAGVKVLPALVALSALGHLLGIAYTVPRVIQELAKDGLLPFPDLFMENRPFKTPMFALLLHLGVTAIFVCAPPAGDAFEFIVSMSSYPKAVLYTLITAGLIRLRLSKRENFQSPIQAPWLIIFGFLAANVFLVVMPLIPPSNGQGSTSLPYWLSSVVPLAIICLGVIYYLVRFLLLPYLLGYQLEKVQQELSDGSNVTRYWRAPKQ